MKCPGCDQFELTDDMKGIIKCPQCHSRLFVSIDKLTGEKGVRDVTPKLQVGPVSNEVTRVVKQIARVSEKELRCVSCTKVITTAFYSTATVIHGTSFAKRHYEERAPILGYIESPFGNHVIGGQMERKTKSFGFLRKSKGPVCGECEKDHSTIETKDGWLPRVKIEPAAGVIGVTLRGEISKVEEQMMDDASKGPLLPVRRKVLSAPPR